MKPQNALIIALMLPGLLAAQRSIGYVFVAPGGPTGNMNDVVHFGGGGEGFLGKGFALGGEVGVATPRESIVYAIGVASPNLSFHPYRWGKAAFDPFVTGGYTLLFREGVLNLANFGGGLNYWVTKRFAVRVEVRDYTNFQGANSNGWGFRFGVALR